jgi:hypothetical protein
MTNLMLLMIVGLLVVPLSALSWPVRRDLDRALGRFAKAMRFLLQLGLVIFCLVLVVALAWRLLMTRALWPAAPVVLGTLAIIFGPGMIAVLRRVRHNAARLSPSIIVVPRTARARE